MNKQEKQALAVEVFEKFQNKSTVFVTPCGQCFFEKNRAILIATADEIETFNRLDVMAVETKQAVSDSASDSVDKIQKKAVVPAKKVKPATTAKTVKNTVTKKVDSNDSNQEAKTATPEASEQTKTNTEDK